MTKFLRWIKSEDGKNMSYWISVMEVVLICLAGTILKFSTLSENVFKLLCYVIISNGILAGLAMCYANNSSALFKVILAVFFNGFLMYNGLISVMELQPDFIEVYVFHCVSIGISGVLFGAMWAISEFVHMAFFD